MIPVRPWARVSWISRAIHCRSSPAPASEHAAHPPPRAPGGINRSADPAGLHPLADDGGLWPGALA